MRRQVGFNAKGRVYHEERGPDGTRYGGWLNTFVLRQKARFGLDELLPDGKISPDNRRRMRNARKQERALTVRTSLRAAGLPVINHTRRLLKA